MKKTIVLPVLLSLLLFSCATDNAIEGTDVQVYLEENTDAGISVTGTSNSSTTSLNLIAENLPEGVTLFIPAGAVLEAENDDVQDMLVLEDVIISNTESLSKSGLNRLSIKTCCLQFHKDPPGISDRYILSEYYMIEDQDLIKIIKYINSDQPEADGFDFTSSEDRDILQKAVWVLSDNLDMAKYLDYSKEFIFFLEIYLFFAETGMEEEFSTLFFMTMVAEMDEQQLNTVLTDMAELDWENMDEMVFMNAMGMGIDDYEFLTVFNGYMLEALEVSREDFELADTNHDYLEGINTIFQSAGIDRDI